MADTICVIIAAVLATLVCVGVSPFVIRGSLTLASWICEDWIKAWKDVREILFDKKGD